MQPLAPVLAAIAARPDPAAAIPHKKQIELPEPVAEEDFNATFYRRAARKLTRFPCSRFPFSTDCTRTPFFDFGETTCFGVHLVVTARDESFMIDVQGL
jgi:hypothetical protein